MKRRRSRRGPTSPLRGFGGCSDTRCRRSEPPQRRPCSSARATPETPASTQGARAGTRSSGAGLTRPPISAAAIVHCATENTGAWTSLQITPPHEVLLEVPGWKPGNSRKKCHKNKASMSSCSGYASAGRVKGVNNNRSEEALVKPTLGKVTPIPSKASDEIRELPS